MKFSIIKYKEDMEDYTFLRLCGGKVVELENLEDVDKKIDELINTNNLNIVLSEKLASFSEDINTKYNRNKKVNIFITKSKE